MRTHVTSQLLLSQMRQTYYVDENIAQIFELRISHFMKCLICRSNGLDLL